MHTASTLQLMTFVRLLFISACSLAVAIPSQADDTPPDIIFILVDDQRADFLSFLGHPWVKTPAMDAMARDGVYFKYAMVTTSLCSPSRASILTGRYPFQTPTSSLVR